MSLRFTTVGFNSVLGTLADLPVITIDGQLGQLDNIGDDSQVLTNTTRLSIRETPTTLLEGEGLLLMWDGSRWREVFNRAASSSESRFIFGADYGCVGDGVTDDAAAIQDTLDAAALLKAIPVFGPFTYLVNTELNMPDGSTSLWGTAFAGGDSTIFKAGAAIRSILNLNRIGGSSIAARIRDIGFSGNRLATHCLRLRGCAYSEFVNVGVGGSLEDGVRLVNLDASINDQNTWYNFSSGGCGTLFITQDLVDDEGGLYGIEAPVIDVVAGTCAVATGDSTVTFTGAPDLTSMGPTIGDPIRTGTSTNKRFGVITAVTDATHLEVQFDTSDGLSDVTASGQDFAVARGDGYHDERSGDNNRATFIGGGLHRANAGFAFVFDGLYGPQIANQMVIDFHPFWAIRIGTNGGDPVITPTFDSMYFESLGTTKPFLLRSAISVEIRNPLDSEGDDTDNVSYCGAQANVSGTYMNRNGIFYLGSNAFESHLAAVNVGALFGGGASINGPMKFSSGTATVTAGVVTRANSSVAGSALILVDSTGNPTVSDIAVFGSELLMLGVSGVGTVTLQASSTLHLSTSTYAMTAANGNTIMLVYINSAWHEISRATADKTS